MSGGDCREDYCRAEDWRVSGRRRVHRAPVRHHQPDC
nr:MAG TPA: hypothetical protein [Caudoviricetes sp.]